MVTMMIFNVLRVTLTSSVPINAHKLMLISPQYGGGCLGLIILEDLEEEVVRKSVLFPTAASCNKIEISLYFTLTNKHST